jgi:hypothetical protein
MLGRRSLAVTTAALALATATPAAADDDATILIVPLSGNLTGARKGLPAALTDSLELAAADAKLDAVSAQVSRGELSAVAGCADESPECFLQVADTLGASLVVVGELRVGDGGKVTAHLSMIGTDTPRTDATFALVGADDSALTADFVIKAAAFLSGKPIPKPEPDPKPDPAPDLKPDTKPDPTSDPQPDPIVTPPPNRDDGFDIGRARGYSWAIAGGGIAVTATGLVFLGIADGKQSDVDDHPTDTVQDLEDLAELEDSGKRFNTLGNGMLIAGGIATTVGIVLIVKQSMTVPEDRGGVAITPVPLEGGAGVVVSFEGMPW